MAQLGNAAKAVGRSLSPAKGWDDQSKGKGKGKKGAKGDGGKGKGKKGDRPPSPGKGKGKKGKGKGKKGEGQEAKAAPAGSETIKTTTLKALQATASRPLYCKPYLLGQCKAPCKFKLPHLPQATCDMLDAAKREWKEARSQSPAGKDAKPSPQKWKS